MIRKEKTKKMTSDEFYALIPGAMGIIYYYKAVDIASDPRQDQNFVDEMSREALYAFQPLSGLSPAEYTAMFQAEFLKSRQSSTEQLHKSKICRFSVYIQVGNEECLREIEQLETDPDFKGWENEPFVKELKKSRL